MIGIDAIAALGLPSSAATTAPAAAAPTTREAQDLKKVAQDFEGIFLRQLLEAAKFGNGKDKTYGGMIVEALSSGIMDGGGLGLAKQIEGDLGRMALGAVPTKKP